MIPDFQARLIEAAVRPLADDAEVMQAGKGLLADLTTTPARGAGATLKRWDAIDAKVGKSAWRLFCYLLVTVVLVIALISDTSDFRKYQKIFRSITYLRGHRQQDYFDRTYSAAEKRLLLIGDANVPESQRAKALWDSDPNNAAYFANYAVSYLFEINELPAGFMETAGQLDPGNSFFLYLAAAGEVRSVGTKLRASGFTKISEDRFDHALSIFHDAGKLPRFDNYLDELRRERIPLLPQSTIFEYMDSANYLGRSYSPDLGLEDLYQAIESESSWFSTKGDGAEFIELIRDTDAFLDKMTRCPVDLYENYRFTGNDLSVVLHGLTMDATRLGLVEDATEWSSKMDRLNQWNIDRGAINYLIDGKPWSAKAGILKSSYIQIKQLHPPVLTDADVKPGRMFDHLIFAQICSYAVAAVLGLTAIAAALFRFRSPPLLRRLSARMEVLLLPVDWLWLLAAGIPPLPYLMLVTHLTNLGGYGSRLTETSIDLPYGWHANLPMAQFAGVLLTMLILPILVVRWRLGIRGAAFGFANTRLWLGLLALISAVAFIPLVGWAIMAGAKTGLVAAWWLLGFSLVWLCGVACRAMISGTEWLLHHTTGSRVLVPTYMAALFFLLLTMPLFGWSRKWWFERDSLSHLDAAYPSFSKFEYKLSSAVSKELREVLGYDP